MKTLIAAVLVAVLSGCASSRQIKTSRGVIVVNSFTAGINWTTVYAKHKSKEECAECAARREL